MAKKGGEGGGGGEATRRGKREEFFFCTSGKASRRRRRRFDSFEAGELVSFSPFEKNLPHLVPGLVADDHEQGALPGCDTTLDEGADLFVSIG